MIGAGRQFSGWRREGLTYSLAAFGAAGAWALSLPLALLIGPVVVVTVLAQRLPGLRISPPVYGLSLMVIGMALGQYFTPETLSAWRNIGGALALNGAMTLVALICGGVFLHKVLRYDLDTALFAGLPGGILTVMEVSRESGADPAAVLFFQVFRIVLGATLIPLTYAAAGFHIPPAGVQTVAAIMPENLFEPILLVGGSVGLAVLGRKMRFPSAEISVPLLWSAVLYGSGIISVTIPTVLPALSFVLVGASIGTTLPRPNLPTLIRLVWHTVLLFALFIALTLVTALIGQALLGITLPLGVLTFSPASLTEMIAVSVALDLDPAMVAANNLFRMIACSVAAPLLLLWLQRGRRQVQENAKSAKL